ncbi:MAG: ATP-binding protein [Candidatus Pseudobacter hemicellulosilyticus]|uniref:histidine kinase n=1 Tax=Candidatus Pseudobacter hemicellulosilyticus TaxID=3121375 RepID=A0AAJ5WP86_9BACT|nr:MAG: ATP-binding protein [Pseudobacter sp.]
MKVFAPGKWFRDVSIAKKLYFTVGIMALLIAIELVALAFSINTLSAVRAYVNGEALWSKAQKDAMYQLLRYGRTHNEADYLKYRDYLKVPEGDHTALVEMSKGKDGDRQKLWKGFRDGRNHADDVAGMIKLFTRFYDNHYIHKAVQAWIKADGLIPQMNVIAGKLRQEINSPHKSQQRIDSILDEIDPLNIQVTDFEDEFSFTLGEGSRWMEKVILRILLGIALTVELTGLLLAILVSRSMKRGLDEIIYSAQAVGKGDFSRKARVFSKDEIGILANDFNVMAGKLEQLQLAIREANANLEKKVEQRTAELERKNKELEQFAFVASHDLQEPLKTTVGFVELLRKQYTSQQVPNAEKYLDYILQASERMMTLIKDLLDYSRLGRQIRFEPVDCNILLHQVLADMDNNIRLNNALITAVNLPVVYAFPTELKLLFQNLISNAIKFRRPDLQPEVTIAYTRETDAWKFMICDNGIGIDEQHAERIFIIFQRLHNRNDYEGSGIGLAHCKKIVELHGGKIWVESNPGAGSCFYFTLADVPPLPEENG